MASDDPFAEPDDTEKTVIRPNPGGRRTPAAQPGMQPAAPPPGTAGDPLATPDMSAFAPPTPGYAAPQAPAAAVQPMATPATPGREVAATSGLTGMNPLNAAGATLFSLIGRIRNRAQHMDPGALRESVVAEIRAFEDRALRAQVPAQNVKIARYAICATIDDVVLNTPWGGQSVWTTQSMVGTFHKETYGGDRFFDLLARLEQEPGKNLELLEFIYMCLSLGFEGRLRVEDRGTEKHIAMRDGLARLIRSHRGPVERDLSPRWKGLELPHRPVSAWLSVWLTTGILALVLGGGFFGFAWALSGDTENLQGQLSVIQRQPVPELKRRAPPRVNTTPQIAAAGKSQIEEVRKFLEAEVAEGLVSVLEDASTITVRISGAGMFGSGSDQLRDKFRPVIVRIAAALNEQPGNVIIAGHSDSDKIRTSRFPSNLHLSLARAEAVRALIAETLKEVDRMTAEGRAFKEPLVPVEKSRDDKAKNRRIEVILMKSS